MAAQIDLYRFCSRGALVLHFEFDAEGFVLLQDMVLIVIANDRTEGQSRRSGWGAGSWDRR